MGERLCPFFKAKDLDILKVHKSSFKEYTLSIDSAARKIDTSILQYYWSADDKDTHTNSNDTAYQSETDLPPYSILTTDDLCKRWSVSPTQLLKIIREQEELAVYWEEDNVPF